MTLPKKTSRPITVDNEKYHWLVSPRAKGIIVFIAEKEHCKGALIEVKIKSDINELWTKFPNLNGMNLKVIKPKDAESIIKQAQILGWNPEQSGKPCKFEYDGNKLNKTS